MELLKRFFVRLYEWGINPGVPLPSKHKIIVVSTTAIVGLLEMIAYVYTAYVNIGHWGVALIIGAAMTYLSVAIIRLIVTRPCGFTYLMRLPLAVFFVMMVSLPLELKISESVITERLKNQQSSQLNNRIYNRPKTSRTLSFDRREYSPETIRFDKQRRALKQIKQNHPAVRWIGRAVMLALLLFELMPIFVMMMVNRDKET